MANGNFAGGSGKEQDPYLIEDAFDLDAIRNDLSGHYKLISNIDLDVSPFNEGEGWVPIGNYSSNSSLIFEGTLDGNNYVVKNLFINRPSINYQGLFGYTSGSLIQNIGIENIDVTGGNSTGGLVGLNYNSSIITNCYSTGSVTGEDYTGGLVGNNHSSSVINSYSTGYIAGSSGYTGGLVGFNNYNSSVINCYSTGTVSGGNQVGGLVGYNLTSSIANCYSTGNVTGNGNQVGGLVGLNTNSSIVNCYSTGNVTGNGNQVGGLVGRNYNATVINSFWDKEASNMSSSAGGTGLTTVEMQTAQTFINTDWGEEILGDGTLIWILEDGNYPTLWFNKEPTYSLLKHNNVFKSWNGRELVEIGSHPTIDDYLNHGMVSLLSVPENLIYELKDFEIYSYCIDNRDLELSYTIPASLHIIENKKYKGVGIVQTEKEKIPDNIKRLWIISNYTDCSFEYSLDDGQTWSYIESDEVVNIEDQKGNSLLVKVYLPNETSVLKGLAVGWA